MALHLFPLEGIPSIHPGDDLAGLLAGAIERGRLGSRDGDLLVVCQKVVSKAEGRIVDLNDVEPGPQARRVASELGKDPRIVEVIFRETRRVVRMEQGHLIVETRHGFVCANAGIDESNSVRDGVVILLPVDADRSADALRTALHERFDLDLAVLVTDTFGRAWREGQIDVAVGVAGFRPLLDYRGRRDLSDRELHHTVIAVADELACAAGLLMEKDGGVPAVLVRGYPFESGRGSARELVRARERDIFR